MITMMMMIMTPLKRLENKWKRGDDHGHMWPSDYYMDLIYKIANSRKKLGEKKKKRL